jgi:hypothetical protein
MRGAANIYVGSEFKQTDQQTVSHGAFAAAALFPRGPLGAYQYSGIGLPAAARPAGPAQLLGFQKLILYLHDCTRRPRRASRLRAVLRAFHVQIPLSTGGGNCSFIHQSYCNYSWTWFHGGVQLKNATR